MATLPRFTASSALTPVGLIITRSEWVYRGPRRPASCSPPCPAGKVCMGDIGRNLVFVDGIWHGFGDGVCCSPGEFACENECHAKCPGNQTPSSMGYGWNGLNACECACRVLDKNCYGDLEWDDINCRCYCPPNKPCPDPRMTRNGDCDCVCPAPLTDCGGYCCDLQNDVACCGTCNALPCDVLTEKCCGGKCTNVCDPNEKVNCGDCGRAVQAGEKCCGCWPTKLGTNINCSDCGDPCEDGRTCIDHGSYHKCECPPGTRECKSGGPCCPNSRDCANGVCCPTGTKECSGACVNLNTNTSHCGGCNRPCPQGASCINGQCQCPPNQIACNYPNARCLDNITPAAGPTNQWQIMWRQQNPGVPFFTCANGQLTCAPSLVQLVRPNGLSACCPAGSTSIDANGNCR